MSKAQKEAARVAAGLRHALAEWRSASEAASAAAKQLRALAACKRHAERVLNMALLDAHAVGIRRVNLAP